MALLFALGQRHEVAAVIIIENRVAGLSAQALARFVLRARRAVRLAGRVNVLVTSSAEMRSLNLRFRNKDKATDVLSFPADSSAAGVRHRALAGEIAISSEVACENAIRLRHSPAVEVKILALHGILHLAGFDHERDNEQMARKEAKLRRVLGLPSSLTERTQTTLHAPESHRGPRLRKGRRPA